MTTSGGPPDEYNLASLTATTIVMDVSSYVRQIPPPPVFTWVGILSRDTGGSPDDDLPDPRDSFVKHTCWVRRGGVERNSRCAEDCARAIESSDADMSWFVWLTPP